MKNFTFAALIFAAISFFGLNAHAQNSDDKISAQDQKEIKTFVDDFTRSYARKLELEKIADSFFVSNYKKQNYKSMFIENLEKSMSNKEKRKNYFTFLDFFNLVFLTKLEDSNYDLKSLANASDFDDENFEKFLFSNKLKKVADKYPRAKLLLLKENFSEIRDVEKYRSVMNDYRNIVREAGNSITAKQREKYSKFIIEDTGKFFKIINSSECSKEECRGLPEKTKIFICESFPFLLVIAQENKQLKIVGIALPTD